jgi:hypothetical protein
MLFTLDNDLHGNGEIFCDKQNGQKGKFYYMESSTKVQKWVVCMFSCYCSFKMNERKPHVSHKILMYFPINHHIYPSMTQSRIECL